MYLNWFKTISEIGGITHTFNFNVTAAVPKLHLLLQKFFRTLFLHGIPISRYFILSKIRIQQQQQKKNHSIYISQRIFLKEEEN